MMTIKESLLGVLLLNAAGAFAANDAMSVANIEVPQGGSVELTIALNNETANLSGWQCDLGFSSDGLSLTLNAGGKPEATLSERFNTTGHSISSRMLSNGSYRFVVTSNDGEAIPGSSGVLFSVTLEADASLEVGKTYEGTLYGIEFFTNDETPQTILMNDVTFTVTIGEPADTRTVLDENSTTVPAAATDVDVRVKRTIKANEWSTIVLPFAMSAEQVKAAFGDDVQLADFTGTEPEFDNDDNCVAVMVNFDAASAIEANHPYIIKVSQPVEEFTVDGVDIVADEDEAYIEFDNGLTGRKRVVYSGFYGTYHAGTEVPEYCLFLNGNKFWYSTGQTTMKAFRAYFEFIDILAEVENAAGVVEFNINFDDATGIKAMDHSPLIIDHYYNLSGQRVGKNYKGIVVTKGKKALR